MRSPWKNLKGVSLEWVQPVDLRHLGTFENSSSKTLPLNRTWSWVPKDQLLYCCCFLRAVVKKKNYQKLKRTEICSFTVLEAKSPNYGRAVFLLEATIEENSFPSFSTSGGSKYSLTCSHIPSISASVFISPFHLLVSYKDTVNRLRAQQDNPGWFHL